jgi:hypothetical protein
MECGRCNGHAERRGTIKGENYELRKLDRFDEGIPEIFVGKAPH